MELMYDSIRGCGFWGAALSPPLAGMNWNNETNCSSRSQNANNYQWNTNSNISTHFLVDPGTMDSMTPVEKELVKLTPWLELNSLLILKMSKTRNRRKERISSN